VKDNRTATHGSDVSPPLEESGPKEERGSILPEENTQIGGGVLTGKSLVNLIVKKQAGELLIGQESDDDIQTEVRGLTKSDKETRWGP